MTRFVRANVCTVWLLLALGCAALAQSGKGTISGRVTDSVGGVLQGAQVTLKPGGSSTATNTQGEYSFAGLAAGDYTVTVNYIGFTVADAKVNLTAGQAARADLKLDVASQNESIICLLYTSDAADE